MHGVCECVCICVRGQSKLVLRPKTTKEVSKVLAHCHKRRLVIYTHIEYPAYSRGKLVVFRSPNVKNGILANVISM